MPTKDARRIKEMSSEDKVKQVLEYSPSVLRLLEVANVLAQGEFVSSAELKEAKAAQKIAEDKAFNLGIALGVSKDKLKKKTEELKRRPRHGRKRRS